MEVTSICRFQRGKGIVEVGYHSRAETGIAYSK